MEQICLFLLAESHHLRAKLVQTSPREGHVRHSRDSKGVCNIIDLDLSRYDKLAKRFEVERQNDLSFLKQGIDTRNKAFNRLIETIERVAVRSSDPILLPGLADRREDIEPNLDYELARFSRRTGKHISFNKEGRERFLAFALETSNRWAGNFRDLNAMVVRMATLADGGRITAELVAEEIDRSRAQCGRSSGSAAAPDGDANLAALLGADYQLRHDDIDLVQLAHVVRVCRESATMADAAKRLFSVSRLAKKSANDSDRLSKYLAKFGLRFREL